MSDVRPLDDPAHAAEWLRHEVLPWLEEISSYTSWIYDEETAAVLDGL
jgi:hypothetical protein